jgi:hypothetical protein
VHTTSRSAAGGGAGAPGEVGQPLRALGRAVEHDDLRGARAPQVGRGECTHRPGADEGCADTGQVGTAQGIRGGGESFGDDRCAGRVDAGAGVDPLADA